MFHTVPSLTSPATFVDISTVRVKFCMKFYTTILNNKVAEGFCILTLNVRDSDCEPQFTL